MLVASSRARTCPKIYRAHRAKRCKLAQNRALARLVAGKLQLQWSPRQIADWLRRLNKQLSSSPVGRRAVRFRVETLLANHA